MSAAPACTIIRTEGQMHLTPTGPKNVGLRVVVIFKLWVPFNTVPRCPLIASIVFITLVQVIILSRECESIERHTLQARTCHQFVQKYCSNGCRRSHGSR